MIRSARRSRRGPEPEIAYHVINEDATYRELGFDYNDHRDADRARRRALAVLERRGYRVTLERAA